MILARLFCVVAAAAGISVLASGCANTRSTLGLDKSSPDEFDVVRQAPLSLPPDFNLRPPQPGVGEAHETPVIEQARQAIFGLEDDRGAIGADRPDPNLPVAAPIQQVRVTSKGEALLLARSGAGDAEAGIRRIIDQEHAVVVTADDNLIDRLLGWAIPVSDETVIDAKAEAKRLRENEALGQPVTEGDTPMITRKRGDFLNKIINF